MSYNFNLTNIFIKNFRSVKEVNFEIKNGLFSIEGLNLDQSSSNNGAGKTTIISSLWWALTGSSLNNETLADEVINFQSGKDCKVVCTFISDQGEIKITRTRKDSELGNNLLLEINNQDLSCHKISDTQDRINQLFRVNWDLLKSTIIMTSDMKSCFSSLSPQNRISLLESVRDYSVWNKIREESNKDIKDFDSKIKEINNNINNLQGSINTYKKLIDDNNNELKNYDSNFNKIEIQQKIDQYNINIENYNSEINSISIINNTDELLKISQELQNDLQKITDSANNIKLSINNEEFKEKQYNFDIQNINKWFTNDTCPTCHRKLDRTEEEIIDKNKQKIDLENNLENIKQIKLKYNTELENKRQEYNVKNNEILTIKDKILKLNNESKEASDKVLKLNNKINETKLLIFNLENELKDHESKVNIFKNNIETYNNEIFNKETEKINLENENNELEEKKEISKFFYESLGPKGSFRPSLLKKDIEYLNKCINRYVKRFFDNTDIYLTIPDMSNNKIDIIINQNNVIKPVSCLSGGETKRLNLCIQLGIYDLIKSTCLINFNICIFDEIESALDEAGIRSLINIIEERKEYVPSIYWITNNSDVKQSIQNKVICKKANGLTTVEYKEL